MVKLFLQLLLKKIQYFLPKIISLRKFTGTLRVFPSSLCNSRAFYIHFSSFWYSLEHSRAHISLIIRKTAAWIGGIFFNPLPCKLKNYLHTCTRSNVLKKKKKYAMHIIYSVMRYIYRPTIFFGVKWRKLVTWLSSHPAYT